MPRKPILLMFTAEENFGTWRMNLRARLKLFMDVDFWAKVFSIRTTV
jgi:hypothetical protein